MDFTSFAWVSSEGRSPCLHSTRCPGGALVGHFVPSGENCSMSAMQ